MNKVSKIFGIDISKDTFDVMDSDGNHYQFSNNFKHFLKFLKLLDSDSHCVMEATGYYHYQLAYFLSEHNIRVSVENPLSIKRFIQMKLSKIKTDKSDAKMICLYGQQMDMKLWKGPSANQLECLQMLSALDIYTKQGTALQNKIQSHQVLSNPSKTVVNSLKRTLKSLQKEMVLIEEQLTDLVKSDHRQTLTKLQSIPGLGRKTAIMLLVVTDGFNRFENASQLCSYTGLTPVIRQSGTSVYAKPRISKIGHAKLRSLLFMCSLTACKHNKACREIFERITNKGKSKKLALMAVCNKLLKQAFAIAKSGLEYDATYRSVLKN